VSPKEVTTLETLKKLMQKHSIKTLYCLFEDNHEGDPPIGIRLYFYHGGDIYFLRDYAHNDKLIQSSIPVRFHGSSKTPYISETDVISFRDKELKGINVSFDFEI
jgi:hypothetical protein